MRYRSWLVFSLRGLWPPTSVQHISQTYSRIKYILGFFIYMAITLYHVAFQLASTKNFIQYYYLFSNTTRTLTFIKDSV